MSTRGPQNILEGYARDAARGGAGRTMRENVAAMDLLIASGLVSDGNTVDGTTKTGGQAYDPVIAQFPHNPLHAWEIPAPLLDISGASGVFLPLAGGTLTGDLTVGTNTAAARLNLNGPAGSTTRNLRWQTAGVTRWALGTDGAAEGATVQVTMAATVSSGADVLPVVTTAGVTSGMQVSVTGVPATTAVISAVGTASVAPTTAADVASGDTVLPISSTSGIAAGMVVLAAGIAAGSLVTDVGGTSGSVTKTTTAVADPAFTGNVLAVSSLTGIVEGMLVTVAGVPANTYVTGTNVGDVLLAVYLSNDFTSTIALGTSVTFSTAIVISKPTTGAISSGGTITVSPAIVVSQTTTGTINSGTTVNLIPNTGANLNLNASNDAGGSWLTPMTFSRATGIPNFSSGLSVIPSSTRRPTGLNSIQPILATTSNWSGRVTSSDGSFFKLHRINIQTDAINTRSAGVVGMHLTHNYGGTDWSGGRVAMAVDLFQTAGFPTAGGVGSGVNNQRIGIQAIVRAGENAGGTSPTLGQSSGSVYGIASYSRLLAAGSSGHITGATNYKELCGYNLNLSTQTGTSVTTKHGLNISPLADDAVQGTVQDAAIHMGMQPGAIGWKNLLAIGNVEGSWPLDSTSNIWGTYRSGAPRAMQVNYGLNWRDIAFTTAFIAAPGFRVDGNGNATSGALVVNTTGNVTTLNTALVHVTNTAVASSPATIWEAGMAVYDANGNQWLCTSTDGTDGTGPGHITGISAVPIAPGYVSSAPSNPVSVTDQSGSLTATLTLTWSASPGLSINSAGQPIGFFGTAPVAKPTGVAVDAASIHAALVSLGLIAA